MEKSKKSKKFYESTKKYSKNYNKANINVQLNRELVIKLREKINSLPLKEYIESLIKSDLNK